MAARARMFTDRWLRLKTNARLQKVSIVAALTTEYGIPTRITYTHIASITEA